MFLVTEGRRLVSGRDELSEPACLDKCVDGRNSLFSGCQATTQPTAPSIRNIDRGGEIPTTACRNICSEKEGLTCCCCCDSRAIFFRKVSVLRDTLRLLGNARNGHKHVFFKFQDSTTLKLVRQ